MDQKIMRKQLAALDVLTEKITLVSLKLGACITTIHEVRATTEIDKLMPVLITLSITIAEGIKVLLDTRAHDVELLKAHTAVGVTL